MNTSKPRVSVIIPSYNHADFVGIAVESVLNQTYSDFELIIVDDASPDGSRAVIETYTDPRIRFYPLTENGGAVPALNLLFTYARGEYVALLNSDDFWEKRKLEKQVAFLDKHQEYGMVFSYARLVTQNSTPEKWTEIPETLFDQKNRSQGGWLRKLFFDLNCLCNPSMMVRKSLWNNEHEYCCSMRQCPDLEMHIHYLKKANLYVLPEKLINLRIMDDASNASAVTANNLARSETEIMLMLPNFFDGMSEDVFLEGFSDLCTIKGKKTQVELECEQAMMYLKVENPFRAAYTIVALQKLHALLNKEKSRTVLCEKFGFSYRDFFKLTAERGLHDVADQWLSENTEITGGSEFMAETEKEAVSVPIESVYDQISMKKYIRFKLKKRLRRYPGLYIFLKKMIKRSDKGVN